MRVGMGLIKNEYGVYHVRRKVPKALEVATARAMGVPKERVSWLKETLGTKDEKQARVRAKPVMMKFDRILAQAEALLVEHPMRTELTEAEIKRIADYFYAHELGGDEALREDGIGSDPIFASVHRQLVEAAFRIQKDQLNLRPIWHQREDRVQAHILVCFLAFVLWKSLEMWQSRAGLGNSPRIILEELKRIQSQDVILPTAAHGQIRLRCVTQPDPAQAALLNRLGIVLPKRMRLAEQHLPALEHSA